MEPKETQPRQPPSVPFVWEELPGLPKKNWQPSLATFVPSPPTLPPPVPVPVKLVTSVPFCWEKTPGERLLKLPQPPSETATTTPLPPPVPVPVKLVTSVPFCWEEAPGQPYRCFVEAADSHNVQVTTASNDINFGFPVRTQYTLRELIMMSRRRNYMRKHNPSMEFTKYGAESSRLFELEGSEWKRYQRRMKLLQ